MHPSADNDNAVCQLSGAVRRQYIVSFSNMSLPLVQTQDHADVSAAYWATASLLLRLWLCDAEAQKRWCPHGTKASRVSRCCTRHTSHKSCDCGSLTVDWGWSLSLSLWTSSSSSASEFAVRSSGQRCADTVTHCAQKLHACVPAAVEAGNASLDA